MRRSRADLAVIRYTIQATIEHATRKSPKYDVPFAGAWLRIRATPVSAPAPQTTTCRGTRSFNVNAANGIRMSGVSALMNSACAIGVRVTPEKKHERLTPNAIPVSVAACHALAPTSAR